MKNDGSPHEAERYALKKIRLVLEKSGASCVVVKQVNGRRVKKLLYGGGVRPLIEELKRDSNAFTGAYAADKIIGKAAALLFVYGGVRAVYAQVISIAAQKVFESAQIPYEYKTAAEYILNRNGDGMCPMEELCAGIDDAKEAYKKLSKRLFQ